MFRNYTQTYPKTKEAKMKEFNNKIAEIKHIQDSLTDSEDEYTVLNTSTLQDQLDTSDRYHYQTQTDYEAPYYAELISQWRIGTAPLNQTGMITISYKMKTFIDRATLTAYKDAGVSTFLIENIAIQQSPIFFRDNTFGTVVIKTKQDNFFESDLMQINSNYSSELNSEVTGTIKQVDLDDIDAALSQVLVTYDYHWYGASLPSYVQEGTIIRNTVLVNVTMAPVFGSN